MYFPGTDKIAMSEQSTITPYEEKEIRCPKLGGQVNFGYCSNESSANPCQRALVCWAQYFDVESFFRERLGDEAFQEFFFQPLQPKIVTLLDLIEKARNATKK